MGFKNGGFLADFWLTGPDIESSTAQELEHLSEMMARTVNQLDTHWCIHFELSFSAVKRITILTEISKKLRHNL